jgi:TRAP-type uncharacterized transport system substrate-binding protein
VFKVTDFFNALDKDDELRVFEIGGKSARQNAIDLSFARGVDAAIVQSDILEALRSNPPYPGIEGYLRYVAKLYDKEVHILATTEIKSIDELKGKKVNFGTKDSDNYATASMIFEKLGIDVVPTELSPTAALEEVRGGEIAAMFYVAPKPVDLFNFGSDEKVHFLSIPGESKEPRTNAAVAATEPAALLEAGYTPTALQPEDYYQLIEPNKPVHTVAVSSILMVYNFPRSSERYRKVTRFVRQILDAHAHTQTQTPIRWPDIDMAASVSGWTRFPPAAEWKQAHNSDHDQTMFASAKPVEDADKLKLFTDFVEYQKRQQQAAAKKRQEEADKLKLFTDFIEYQKQQQQATAEKQMLFVENQMSQKRIKLTGN